MRRRRFSIEILLAVIVTMITLFSCQTEPTTEVSQQTETVTATETIEVDESVTLDFTPANTPSPTYSPSPTSTESPVPSETLMPTLVPLTPLPTFSPEEMEEAISNLLASNGDCELPCWWGINPGHTAWSDTFSFLSQFDSDIYIAGDPIAWQFIDVQIPLTEELSPTFGTGLIDLSVFGGLVEYIQVSEFSGADAYSISEIMSQLGEPHEIWMSTVIYIGAEFPFIVTLFYPDIGVIAIYSEFIEKWGDNLNVCLVQSASLMLWPAEQPLSFEDAAAQFNWDVNRAPNLPIFEATGLTVSLFYEENSGVANDVCLESPAELWPQD